MESFIQLCLYFLSTSVTNLGNNQVLVSCCATYLIDIKIKNNENFQSIVYVYLQPSSPLEAPHLDLGVVSISSYSSPVSPGLSSCVHVRHLWKYQENIRYIPREISININKSAIQDCLNLFEELMTNTYRICFIISLSVLCLHYQIQFPCFRRVVSMLIKMKMLSSIYILCFMFESFTASRETYLK